MSVSVYAPQGPGVANPDIRIMTRIPSIRSNIRAYICIPIYFKRVRIADPDTSVADLDTSVADPDSSVADPDSSVADPDTSVADPNSSVADSDPTI